MNYRTHTQRLPLVQPMYYSHPKCQAAYEVPNQYWFGSELVAVPITEKQDAHSGMAKVTAWLPQGSWFDLFSGAHYASKRGRKLNLHRDLHTVPVLAKAGAIVPMAEYPKHENRLLNAENMNILVFPGADNVFTLYEDAGDYSDYQSGAFAQTEMTLRWDGNAVFTIAPVQGDRTLIPEKRNWNVKLRGFHKDISVIVTVDGEKVPAKVTREGNTTCVCVTAAVTQRVQLEMTGDRLIHDNADASKRIADILQRSQLSTLEKEFLMDTVLSDKTCHEKLVAMHWRSYESAAVVDAIKEQMSLTECEYLGKQL
jgi:hypothetical protein